MFVRLVLILSLFSSVGLSLQSGFSPLRAHLAPQSDFSEKAVVQTIRDFILAEIEQMTEKRIRQFSSNQQIQDWFGVGKEVLLKALNLIPDEMRAYRNDTLIFQIGLPGRKFRDFLYNGVVYASLSEGAFGILMERYLPGFKLKKQVNYEVWVDGTPIDFLVNGSFVEFHPVFFNGDRLMYLEAQRKAGKVRLKGDGKEKRYLRSIGDRELERFYLTGRQAHVDRHPLYRGKKVVLVRSAEEFYFKVIVPYGRNNVPNLQTFLWEFEKAKDRVRASDTQIRQNNLRKSERLAVPRIVEVAA